LAREKKKKNNAIQCPKTKIGHTQDPSETRCTHICDKTTTTTTTTKTWDGSNIQFTQGTMGVRTMHKQYNIKCGEKKGHKMDSDRPLFVQ
jgi:hypothetical protein